MKLAQIEPALASTLRAEAHGMAAAYLEALLSQCPAESVISVYAKGSAYRPWDSVIDYVPELSDVDIHARTSSVASDSLRTSQSALNVAEAALSRFRRAFPQPHHTPRPQLFFLDDLENLPGYVPSPRESVITLFGPDYQAGTRADYANSRAGDFARFKVDADFISTGLAGKVIDRPGRMIWNAVSALTWRVGPAGPRLLTQLGVDPYDAWSWNRTRIVEELLRRDCPSVADAYVDFYLAGWDGFRSRFEDDSAGRRAVLAADQLFAESLRVLDVRGSDV